MQSVCQMAVLVAVVILLSCFAISGATLCHGAVAQSAPVGCSASRHYVCEVEAGAVLTVPCGGDGVLQGAGAHFNYTLVLGGVHTPQTFNNRLDLLNLNATPQLNGALIYCSSNVLTSTSCYGIRVLYAPQITRGAGVYKGTLNGGYCLSCQIEANPPPTCSWNIMSFHFLRGFTHVFPEGVSYPSNPEQECDSFIYPFLLPQPVYQESGCVVKIQSLTVNFQQYYLLCTASNALGSISKAYGPIEIQECGADSSEMDLTPSEMVSVTVGDRVTIRCSVSNFRRNSKLVWFHNNLHIPLLLYQDTIVYHEDSCVYETLLVFESISYMDGGNYTCHFYDGPRFAIDKHLYVSVVPPRVLPCDSKAASLTLSSPNNGAANITIGTALNVTCTANNAANSSKIAWLHNGTPVVEGVVVGSKFRAESCTRESTISIVAGNISDGGNYSCYFWSGSPADPLVKSFIATVLIPQPGISDDGVYTVSGAVTGIVAFIILIAVILSAAVALNRKKLPNYFIRWKLKEPGYIYERNGEKVPFDFDVFLSFARENEYMADVTIRQELEKRSYSVCWHHKDFIAGKLVTENINECISACRKTIIILSDSFLESEYCKYELVISMAKLKKTSTRCVVPVLIAGSCESQLIPPEVLALTYLTVHSQKQRVIDKLCDIIGKPMNEHEVQ